MNYEVIFDFTGSYRKLDLESRKNAKILDLSDLPETNGYCSDEAAKLLRERLSAVLPQGVHYLDDGNHHYLSLFMAEKIEEPFDLVVFDHHTDLQPPALLPFLSCGSWILECLNTLDGLCRVILIGPPKEACPDPAFTQFKDRILVIEEMQANHPPARIETERAVYLSVDLDVLSKEEFETIWDQGSMKKEQLEKWIESICASNKVIGIDICG